MNRAMNRPLPRRVSAARVVWSHALLRPRDTRGEQLIAPAKYELRRST